MAALTPDFIADLYGAALENEDLTAFAALIAQAVGTVAAAVWLSDGRQVYDIGLCGSVVESQDPYLAHYSRQDIWNMNLIRTPPDRVSLSCEHTPENEIVRTEFYNDFARRFGLFRSMSAWVQIGPDARATIAIEEPWAKKLLEEPDKARLAPVIPHAKGALRLRNRRQRSLPPADIHSGALDALGFGAVICDAQGRMLSCNVAAELMARAGGGLVLPKRGKSLSALAYAETQQLLALIYNAASRGPGGSLRLTGQDGGASVVALVTPVPANLGPRGSGYALVALRSLRDAPSFSDDMLVALFGLSRAQAAIARALFRGKSPEQIAAERGVSISTLRTHLSEIFAKTGSENQRDLLRLLGLIPQVRSQSGTG